MRRPAADETTEQSPEKPPKRERSRANLEQSLSLSEYHAAKYADRKPGLQQTANMAYPKLKGR